MADQKVRVGLIGVGNCASSLVQGLTYYREASGNEPVPGLMHVELGGYHISDIEISSAFDVADAKVGATCPRRSMPAPTIRSVSPM